MRSVLQTKQPVNDDQQNVIRDNLTGYELLRLRPDPELIVGFELDSDVQGVQSGNVDVRQVILGWVQVYKMSARGQVQMFLQQNQEVTYFDFDTEREDVVDYFKRQQFEGDFTSKCGFTIPLMLTDEAATIGVVIEGTKVPLYEIVNGGQSKVLHGEDGWLFLKNDVNDSIAQFTGEKVLSPFSRWRWKAFMKSLSTFDVTTFLLFVPSKESVYQRYYPIENKGISPVEELVGQYGVQPEIMFPVDILRRSKFDSYRKNDTHWSLWGAWLVTQKILSSVFPDSLLPKVKSEEFVAKRSRGDLGDKIYPPVVTSELSYTGRHYSEFVYYDNQLPNFGRVLGLRNQSAITDKKLLIFGSSSGYFMLSFFALMFRDIMFVHTSGSVDRTLYQCAKPDTLLLQTNARFVTKPLDASVSLKNIMQNKLKSISTSKTSQVKNYVLSWHTENACPGVLHAHELLMALIDKSH